MDIEKMNITPTENGASVEINLSKMDQEIAEMLKILRLPAMRDSFLNMVASDEIANYSATELLHRLLLEQTEMRRNNAGAKRAKEANLWMPEARIELLEEHGIHVDMFKLEQFAKFNFMNYGGLLKLLVSDQYSRNYLASALGSHACMNKLKTFYIKFDHLVIPEYQTTYEHAVVDIEMLRKIPLLIIDDWLNHCIDEETTNYLKSILEYRFTKGLGTILASCYRTEGWAKFLTGTSNTIKTFNKWFEIGNELTAKGYESIPVEDIG